MTKKRVKRLVFTNIDTGETVVVKTSLKKWSEERGLDYKCMWSLCYGVRKIYRGWYVGTTPPIPTVKKTRKGEKRKVVANKMSFEKMNPGEMYQITSTFSAWEMDETVIVSCDSMVFILEKPKKTSGGIFLVSALYGNAIWKLRWSEGFAEAFVKVERNE